MKKVNLIAAILLVVFSALNAQTKSKIKAKTSVQLIRNATVKINYAGKTILLDPMFSPKGTFDSFADIARNPTEDLKMPISEIKKNVNMVLVTHTHPDHFDQMASDSLPKTIKIYNQPADKEFMQKENFTNAETLNDSSVWEGITVFRTGGKHGSGDVLQYMGTVSGFVLKAKNEPTIYIIGDCIWTEEIEQNIIKYNPDVIIVNSGGAVIPGFEKTPILMDEEQTMKLINASAKAKIIAVHMESLDHCRVTRASLRKKADELKISKTKLLIPQDGEIIELKTKK